MNKQRLEQMVTMLRALPPEKRDDFNLIHWKCGTTACAVGHACVDPVFTEQGLRRSYTDAPSFEGRSSWDAVERFFDLNNTQSNHLFSVDEYPEFELTTPDQVASRIAQFIESDGSGMQLHGGSHDDSDHCPL